MKINIESLVIGIIAAIVVSKYYQRDKNAVGGFYPSNEPFNQQHPGPLKPYGARWGLPTPNKLVDSAVNKTA